MPDLTIDTTAADAALLAEEGPADETTTNAAAAELLAVAREIAIYQDAARPRLSNAALIRAYPALGSEKTWSNILRGRLEGYRAEEWLVCYRGVLSQIDEEAATRSTEEIYTDLRPAEEVALAVAQLIRERGKRRLVVVQGGSGAGKTSALRIVRNKYPGTCRSVDAHVGWSSQLCAFRSISRALGATARDGERPVSAGDYLELAIRHVGESRPILLIDEGHHMTGPVLNMLKTLVNETGIRIVIAAIGTLWDKLQRAASQEAMQLVRNRMHCRVILGAPTSTDARRIIERRCPGYRPSARVIQTLIAEAKSNGLYNYVARVAEEAAAAAAEGSEPVPVDDNGLLSASAGVRRDIAGRD